MKPTVNLEKSGGIPMKKYISGFITGTLAIICMIMFLGASQIEEDSLKVMLGRIDAYLSGDTTIGPSGRYQLQSFSIDRTHWHYLLDTTTGELYRMEPSRTPSNARWVLTAEPNFKK